MKEWAAIRVVIRCLYRLATYLTVTALVMTLQRRRIERILLPPFVWNVPIRRKFFCIIVATGLGFVLGSVARAQSNPHSDSAIDRALPSSDRVAKLGKELESGKLVLAEDEKWGLLPSLLKALEISDETQCLVFSKTSFQPLKIGIDRPRAIYFNDDCYVGWVQDSRLIELGAASPEQGAVFYTLDAERLEKPVIHRDRGQCLVCHDNQRTQAVPGFLIRSMFVSSTERFVRDSPAFVTDHRSPFSQRWGGWYVTGSDGEMSHLGNTINQSKSNHYEETQSRYAKLKLPESVVSGQYLRSTSDIVALMVLEHQTQMHNHFARVSLDAKQLELARTAQVDKQSEQAGESFVFLDRLDRDSEDLIRYLLMTDEFKLTSSVAGDSAFTDSFSEREPQDSLGRSLYQLDLQSRLFRFPCSYLVYSDVFESLPVEAKRAIGKCLGRVLLSEKPIAGYEGLSDDDRQAVVEILRDTKKTFWDGYVEPNRRRAILVP